MAFDIGQVYRSSFSVSEAGTPVNPSTVGLVVTVGLDEPITPAITNPPAQTGLFLYDHTLATPGLHCFTWTSQGPGTSEADYVNARRFIALFSLDEARDYLGILDSRLDSKLRTFMAAAARITERQVGTCVIRDFTGDWIPGTTRPVIRVPRPPLPSDTAITRIWSVWPGGPSWATADLIINPGAGTAEPKDGLGFWYGPWRADYKAGRIEISEDIEAGSKQVLWDLWATQRNLTNDTEYPDLEEVIAIEAGYRLSPFAKDLLAAETMPGFA